MEKVQWRWADLSISSARCLDLDWVVGNGFDRQFKRSSENEVCGFRQQPCFYISDDLFALKAGWFDRLGFAGGGADGQDFVAGFCH